MSYFDSLIKKVSQIQPASIVNPNFNNLKQDLFKNGIKNAYNTMDDPQLSVFIRNNIDEIIKDIQKKEIPYIDFFRDVRFIDNFIRAISSIPMSYTLRQACNNLAYDYFTCDNPNPTIKQKYLDISRVANKADINKLMCLGIPENTASNLALCRFSSNKDEVNAKRLNFALYFQNPDFMTEQMIVWIYEKLFDKIKYLFIATMLETYSKNEMENFGPNFSEIYGRVSNAILIIVNNMESEGIKRVLCAYHEAQKIAKCPVRFSLRSLSNDYARILRVVEILQNEYNIYIP